MVDRRARAALAARTQVPFILMALAPGALTVYLAFNSGGFFAGEPAAVATVLLVVLAVRVMLAPDPAAGVSRGLLVAAAALALFVLWTLVSGGWSGSRGRAFIESDRALLYLVALVLFGSLGGGAARLRWMIGAIALAAVVVCAISLTTRLLPDVWSLSFESFSPRLNYPITYWNALGLLAAVGVILCFGMTCNERESRVVRVLACAAIPVLASTLLLTLSRGGILVAIVGVVVFMLVGHPRALLSGLAATAPATAIALLYTYDADLLVSDDLLSQAARDQGETVAVVIGLCVLGAALSRALLLRVDSVLTGLPLTEAARRRTLAAGVFVVVMVLSATAVVVDAPRQFDRFFDAEPISSAASSAAERNDPRARLNTVLSNSRVTQWRVAFDAFERAPVRGSGAGTYEFTWNRDRAGGLVRDGHSLYLEVLSELGLLGLVFVASAILAILAGIALRIRGPNRVVYATLFAASLSWAIAAGIDWHWEMPVVTLWFFALGGMALARSESERPLRVASFPVRSVVAGVCCVLALLMPARVAVSQDRLKVSLGAFLTGQCKTASDAARQSLRALDSRPQPYEYLAYCALVDRKRALAVSRMSEAVQRDPNNWSLHYALARMQAMAGRDPRRAVREALRLNPLQPLARDAAKRFAGVRGAAQWRRAAQGMEILLPDV